jgi:hypothetical protein
MDFFTTVFRPFARFESFWTQRTEDYGAIRASRAYLCQCGRPVFFRNSACLSCGTPLGFVAERSRLEPLAPVADAPDQWTLWSAPDGPRFRRCANLDMVGCNWLVPGDAAPGTVCLACSLNRTVSDPSDPVNLAAWRALEMAKRHLVAQLLAMGLPVEPRNPQAPDVLGLAFDFLRPTPEQPVLTGHDHGLITLNMDEADDARREQVRAQMGESYRTLLGHFRHEVGHYYWDRLVLNSAWLDDYRGLFGDERASYAEALQRNYTQGPPPDWPQHFVSSYASTHPWEDWAETWAHYLHMVDTLGTAMRFGLDAKDVELPYAPFTVDALWRPQNPDAEGFLQIVNGWVELTGVLNEMSRSMGEPDFYPFVLTPAVVAKLQFIHCVVLQARQPVQPDAPAPMQTQVQAQQTTS